MSSMLIKCMIRYSVSRARPTEIVLSRAGGVRCGNVDRADYAVRPVVEMHHGFQLVGQTAFNHLRAQPFAGRWCDRRPVLLLTGLMKVAAQNSLPSCDGSGFLNPCRSSPRTRPQAAPAPPGPRRAPT